MLLNPFDQLRVALGETVTVDMRPAVTHSLTDISNAVASVMNYIITDAFDLAQEESFWVGYQLNTILEPVSALRPRQYLSAVRYELDTKEYSNKLFDRNWDESGKNSHLLEDEHGNALSKQAPISEWAEMLSEIVLVSYPDLRAFIATTVIGSIYGVLQELGLSENLTVSRKSLYLPNAIRLTIGLGD